MGNGPYWDHSWNWLRGCSRCSPGCGDDTGGGCWAERMATRLSGPGRAFDGLVKGGRWTGEVRFVPEVLEKPLRARQPGRWFLDMSDPFHPVVKPEWVAAAFGVMAAAPSQTFLLLTKRPERMLKWAQGIVEKEAAFGMWPEGRTPIRRCGDAAHTAGAPVYKTGRNGLSPWNSSRGEWPLPNVLLGATICNQAEADRHLPVMRQLAGLGWRTWVSFEPLLEAITADLRGIEWIVPGCESGPRRRRCETAWLHDLCAQGARDGCRVFLKQVQRTADGIVVSDPAAAEWPVWGVREFPSEVTP